LARPAHRASASILMVAEIPAPATPRANAPTLHALLTPRAARRVSAFAVLASLIPEVFAFRTLTLAAAWYVTRILTAKPARSALPAVVVVTTFALSHPLPAGVIQRNVIFAQVANAANATTSG
jgi:hypothetical protein